MIQEAAASRNKEEMMEITKGKWKVVGANHVYCDINESESRLIAKIGGEDEETEANAHLIAAAPDMYEALKDAEKTLRRNGIVLVLVIRALAKAEVK